MKYLKHINIYLYEAGLGYPMHIINTPSIAGIEEEDLDSIIIIEDSNNIKYAISEDNLDLFLKSNTNFKIKHTNFKNIIVNDISNRPFEIKKDTIQWIDGKWKLPKYPIRIVS